MKNQILTFLNNHPELKNASPEEIAKSMIVSAINNTVWAEDAYPGIKDRLLQKVDDAACLIEEDKKRLLQEFIADESKEE